MNSSLSKRVISLLLTLLVAMQLCVPVFADDDPDIVYINDAEDLIKLSDNCRYDAWSFGKTVVLQNDISLSGMDFTPLASFGGTFEGNYHTITGLNVSGHYSPAGFIGVLETSGTVRCLNLEGTVAPGGSAEMVGGIAGINRGLIDTCSFTGNVDGEKCVGGIAGENSFTGIIRRSSTSGGIFGKDRTGGITGNNRGSIGSCSNKAYVNTQSIDPSISFSDLDLNFANGLNGLSATDIYDLTVDSGGIAGFSDGEILSCRNSGSVGYQHIGYNLGGIVGRSSGHVANCTNDGSVHGRREIGGIAGTAEPFVKIDLSSDSVAKLREQLNALSRSVNKAADDADNSSAVISSRLSVIDSNVDDAANNAQALTDNLHKTIEYDVSEINRGSEILSNSIDRLETITRDLRKVVGYLDDAADYISAAMDKLESGSGGSVYTNLRQALDAVRTQAEILEAGIQRIEDGISKLRNAVNNATGITGISMADVTDAYNSLKDGFDIISNGRGGTSGDTGGVFSYIKPAADSLSDALKSVKDASQQLKYAARSIEYASDELSDTMRDANSLMSYLNAQKQLEFKGTGTEGGKYSDALYDSMRSISDNIELLNQEVKSSSDVLVSDVRQINNNFNALMNTLLDVVEELENGSASSYIRDTSDEDIDSVVSGKILMCSNIGAVDGDYDAGGIAGAMMIFNALDPESDDLTISSSLRRKYELKCVLQNCRNEGNISGKRDNIGSVCGNGMFGVISGCEGYGTVSSSGNYVGGIAGFANNTVRRCWSKASLSGNKYVGGIVGGSSAKDSDILVDSCFALPEITEYSQYGGAVTGYEFGTLRNNRFVSDDLAGAGTASLKGKAEPVSYEEAVEDADIPAEFRHFTLSFVADGESVSVQRFNYGDSFDESVFPAVPRQEGKYGYWDRSELKDLRFDTVVTAVYEQELSTIDSGFKRSASRPAFFVEGAFNDNVGFDAEPAVYDFKIENEGIFSILRSFRRSIEEQWQLTLPDDGAESHFVRYLSPEMSKGRVELYLLTGGQWQRIDTENFGSYQRFVVDGSTAQITVTAEATPWWVWGLAALFVLAGLLLAADLVFRRRKKDAVTAEEKQELEKKKTKKKRFRIILTVLLLVIAVILSLAIRLMPRISKSLELYNLLLNFSQRSQISMRLDYSGSFGEHDFETGVDIFVTECEDQKLSRITWEGNDIYFCNDTVILENGKCFRAQGILADYSQLFSKAASMYNTVNIDVSEQNGVRIYHADAEGEDAKLLITTLIPGVEGLIGDEDSVSLNLIVTDGEMSSLNMIWIGENGFLSANATILEDKQKPEIPVSVRSAIASKAYENAEDIGEDVRVLLHAWMELSTSDPISADVTLSANAGPVILSEDLLWQRTGAYGKMLSMVSRRGRVLYFTDDTFCTDSGLEIQADNSCYTSDDLMRLVYQALLLGDYSHFLKSTGEVYRITLDEDAIEEFESVIAPSVTSLDISNEAGIVELVLNDGAISRIDVVLRGSVRVVTLDVNSSVSAHMAFHNDSEFNEPSDEVLETLGLD